MSVVDSRIRGNDGNGRARRPAPTIADDARDVGCGLFVDSRLRGNDRWGRGIDEMRGGLWVATGGTEARPAITAGLAGSAERLKPGLGAAQNQCVDVVGAFIGIDRFQIA